MRKLMMLAFVGMLGLALAACAGSKGAGGEAEPAPEATTEGEATPAEGTEAAVEETPVEGETTEAAAETP
ncbi:hypothetical protein ACFL6C_01715 [Myxococcota bacterium]